MINPNTLQIGNLLLDLNGRICKVESVESEINNCKIYAIYDPVTTLPFSPLPITEERLRDAGFVEYPTGRFRLDHFVIDDRDHIYLGSTPMVRKGAWHDLQNLVRLISGKII